MWMGPPCPISEKNDRIRISVGVWVRHGPVVRQTPEYRSTLAKQWWERQGTDTPWRSSRKNAGVPVLLGRVMVETPGYGSADELVRKAPEQESFEGRWVHHAPFVRKAIEYGSPMEDGWMRRCQ
ncbi:hypothetical protein Y032_0016g2929 [Ancylostoma ceylanicum]|uniref:Uncharacterized protein n=1 Tax=Ancylostoma ceylanicum TaxID=53326 RepID=A0A016V5M1_9BILA|nr:hypothetical protein Y032_0016g2929 [Ancylostoma ceylanicum]